MPNQKRWSKLVNEQSLTIGQRFYSAHRIDQEWQTALYELTDNRQWKFIKLADSRTRHRELRVNEERGLTHTKGTELVYVPYKQGHLWKDEQTKYQSELNQKLIEQAVKNEKLWSKWKAVYASDRSETDAICLAVSQLRYWSEESDRSHQIRAAKLVKLAEEMMEVSISASPSATPNDDIKSIGFDAFYKVVRQQIETIDAGTLLVITDEDSPQELGCYPSEMDDEYWDDDDDRED